MKACAVDGCGRPSRTRGWCSLHYQRWKRYGDPTTGRSRIIGDDERRFWSYVCRDGDACWVWTGSTNEDGYGRIWIAKKSWAVHRYSYKLANPLVDIDGFEVCHRCDNPPCVRPDHLFVGTHSDNIEDMRRKGRARSGPVSSLSSPTRKLDPDDVSEIRRVYASGSHSLPQLGRMYGVTTQMVHKIVQRRAWTWVT